MSGCLPLGLWERMARKSTPHVRDPERCHVWEYLHSPYSIWCLGRLWAQGPPVVSETWSWHSQPVPGSPLQAHFCLGGGSVRCLVGGCLQGFLPAAVTCIPAVVGLPKHREVELPGSLREPWLPYLDVSQCCLFLPPCTWNLIGNRPVWAEKVVSAWAVNWPAFVSLSQFYCCFSTMVHSASVTWRKAWQADVLRNSFQVQRGQGFPFSSAANPNFTFSF